MGLFTVGIFAGIFFFAVRLARAHARKCRLNDVSEKMIKANRKTYFLEKAEK
jgi:hypothetical protein